MAKFLHWCMITDYIMPIIGEILMILMFYDSPNHQIKVFAKFSYIMYIIIMLLRGVYVFDVAVVM